MHQWHLDMYNDQLLDMSLDHPSFRQRGQSEAESLLRELALPAGAQVLDVPCGTGRHACWFAQAGMSVTGIDINPLCIQRAQRLCPEGRFEQREMNMLAPYADQFDAVLNLFTSIGYYPTDEENEEVVHGLVRCLKPGGRVVLNLMDKHWMLRHFEPVHFNENDDHFTLTGRIFDPATSYNESNQLTMDKRTGQSVRHYHRCRIYAYEEILDLLTRAGCVAVQTFGNFQGDPYVQGQCSHPVYVGTR